MTRARRLAFILAALAPVLVPGVSAAGGGLSVSPISLEFDSSGRAKALEVSNPGNAATDVQVRLYAWTAENGEDKTTPSADIAFSPPMFHLEPGATQIVRLAASTAPGAAERAYRLYVDQLPGAPAPGQVQMPVRMVLPLFISPKGEVRQTRTTDLRWRATADAAHGRVHLVAANPGARRVRVLNLSYEQDGKSHPIAPGLSGYVLAGHERAWDFDDATPPEILALKAETDLGNLSAQAKISPD